MPPMSCRAFRPSSELVLMRCSVSVASSRWDIIRSETISASSVPSGNKSVSARSGRSNKTLIPKYAGQVAQEVCGRAIPSPPPLFCGNIGCSVMVWVAHRVLGEALAQASDFQRGSIAGGAFVARWSHISSFRDIPRPLRLRHRLLVTSARVSSELECPPRGRRISVVCAAT